MTAATLRSVGKIICYMISHLPSGIYLIANKKWETQIYGSNIPTPYIE